MSKIRHRSDIHIEGHLSASSADFGGLVSFGEDLAISGTLQFQHMSASSARIGESLVVGEDATVSGSFKVGNSMTVKAKEAESAYILLQADDSDDAGDDWKLTAGSTFTIGNDIASAGSDVAHVTITPNATVASSTTAIAGVIKIGGNKIQASDGGDTITMDTSDNVTIAGDLTIAGGDTTVGTAGNTTATTIGVVTNTGTNRGKHLTISAGSTTTGLNDINGGNLTLASGGGDGTGTSQISFKTKVSGVDAAAERMVIHGNGNIGIGNNYPGSMLEISKGSGRATLELSSWGAGATAGQAGALIFQKAGTATINTFTAGDHTTAGEVLGRIEAYGVDDDDGATLSSYIEFANDAVSDADSVPGKIVFATSDADDAGSPTERMRIDDGGNVGIGTDSPNCKLHVAGAAAFSGPSEAIVVMGDGDATPPVSTGNLFRTYSSGVTITMFDDGTAGQIINVISDAAIVYDVTGTNLKGGSADITTATGDVTTWVFDGTNWYLLNFMDVSADLSGGH